MSDKKILELLDKLNKALEGLDPEDKKSRAKLEQLIGTINRKLSENKASLKENSFSDEIKDAVLYFEIQHPVIAKILGEIKSALYNIGL